MWRSHATSRFSVRPVCATVAAACCTLVASGQCELDKLLPPDRSEDGNFGRAVAIDGPYLLVGATLFSNAGSAYLYELIDGDARLVRSLFPEDGGDSDEFGWSVAIDGDLIVVGAWEAEHRGVPTGAAYVFHRDEGGADAWGQSAKLVASDGGAFYRFGSAVSISGDTIVVGSEQAFPPSGGDTPVGAAYVFQHQPGDPSTWTQVAKLEGTFLDAALHVFGSAVDIDEDTVIIGDWIEQVGPHVQAGSAYIFGRDQGGQDNWGEVKKFTADHPLFAAHFGSSVSIHGSTVIIGSPRADDNNCNQDSGLAYIFERDQGGGDRWGQVQILEASDYSCRAWFGVSVSIHGDTAVVGAFSVEKAYVWRRAGGLLWSETLILTASDAREDDHFGLSVAVDEDLTLIGAQLDDDNGEDIGSAYVFEVPPLGDVDADCIVGAHDVIVLLGAWGECPHPQNCNNCPPDLNADCVVDAADLIILLGNWG